MPRTSQPALRREHAILQRSSKMGAIGIHGMDLATAIRHLDQQHLATFYAFHLYLNLVAMLQGLQRGEVFDFELGHMSFG